MQPETQGYEEVNVSMNTVSVYVLYYTPKGFKDEALRVDFVYLRRLFQFPLAINKNLLVLRKAIQSILCHANLKAVLKFPKSDFWLREA